MTWKAPMPSGDNQWRSDTERAELVERLIESEARCRRLERVIREYAEQVEGDPSVGAYVTALHSRIEGLEQNIRRITSRKGQAA